MPATLASGRSRCKWLERPLQPGGADADDYRDTIARCPEVAMLANIIVFVVASTAGAIGWWAGSLIGFMTAFFVSIIGTALGTYYARKWTR